MAAESRRSAGVRVLLAATSLRPSYGGPAHSVSRLAVALDRAGVGVGLWSADGSVADTPLLPGQTSVARLLGGPADAIAAFAPEVIHDNGLWLPHNHRLADLAREAGLPRLVSPRGMLEPWAIRHKRWKKAAAWRLYQRRDLSRAVGLHATAPQEAANLAAYSLGSPIRVIANGVDLPELTSTAPPAGVRTALFLGRIHPVKGLPMLIEAWGRARLSAWRLLIAGPDEAGHQREVEAAVAAHGLGEAVSFTGPVDGEVKTRLLCEADLLVLPSHSESFGMAAAEALAHATPVLTTTAAPWPMLAARGCGWRVAPDAMALAGALREAAACDPATLRRMGAAGRALIESDFGWAKIADEFAALYANLRRAPALTEAAA
jgi:glycosyltransferase involved in cell wall biosynthesis